MGRTSEGVKCRTRTAYARPMASGRSLTPQRSVVVEGSRWFIKQQSAVPPPPPVVARTAALEGTWGLRPAVIPGNAVVRV